MNQNVNTLTKEKSTISFKLHVWFPVLWGRGHIFRLMSRKDGKLQFYIAADDGLNVAGTLSNFAHKSTCFVMQPVSQVTNHFITVVKLRYTLQFGFHVKPISHFALLGTKINNSV